MKPRKEKSDMKRLKNHIALLLSALMICAAFAVSTTASAAVKPTEKTMLQYKSLNLSFNKDPLDSYTCEVEDNNGNITVDSSNEGSSYWLAVKSKEPTASPVTIKLYKNGDTTVSREYRITVKKYETVKMSDQKLNLKTSRLVTIKNPYIHSYKLKYSSAKLKIKHYISEGSKATYTVKGLKKGNATVKAYIKGKLIGSFKVTVGDFKASVKKKLRESTLKYNPHILSYNLTEGGSLKLGEAIKNYHSNGVYSVKILDTSVIAKRGTKKTALTPKAVELYALKTGKTKAYVYEKRGKAAKTKIGTITLNVIKATDAEVFEANRALDNEGIFYELLVSAGDEVDIKGMVVDSYINGKLTTVKYKKSEYSFTFTAGPKDVITVNKNGLFTCVDKGTDTVNKATYTVTFKDGSKASGEGSFDIVDESFFI